MKHADLYLIVNVNTYFIEAIDNTHTNSFVSNRNENE